VRTPGGGIRRLPTGSTDSEDTRVFAAIHLLCPCGTLRTDILKLASPRKNRVTGEHLDWGYSVGRDGVKGDLL
jgi:hypothetical protein